MRPTSAVRRGFRGSRLWCWCDDGRMLQLEVADNWLTMQELDEGDEWPDDPDEPDEEDAKSAKQVQWMESYLDALEELE